MDMVWESDGATLLSKGINPAPRWDTNMYLPSMSAQATLEGPPHKVASHAHRVAFLMILHL